jgi:hypothetical protein
LCSLFSSFCGAGQTSSFLIQRIRDKHSPRKFDFGVFTQVRRETGKVRRFGALENLVNVDATLAKFLRMPTCLDPDSAPTRRARCRIACFDDAPFVIDEL